MTEATEHTAAPAAAEKPARAPRPAPAAADKGRENAEIGALRAKVAQLEEQAQRERRTSDPTSPDYSAELALEELWPGQVRRPT